MIAVSPKVSIITVCFNSAKTIEQTMQSVFEQTYKNVEYIIIDGCSTDETLDIIKKYDDKITYWLSESDKGIYYAMNKGLAKATGDIIGIINSDDWYGQNTVANVVNKFLTNDCDVVYGDVVFVSEDGEFYAKYSSLAQQDKIWHTMIFPHPTCFLKRQVYENFGFFNTDYKVAADYELLLRFYVNKAKFSYLSDDIVYFRFGGLSDNKAVLGYKEIKNASINYGYNILKAYFYYLLAVNRYYFSKVLNKVGLKKLLDIYRSKKKNVILYDNKRNSK